MRLLIVGSRSVAKCDFTAYVPDNVDLIITGGAKGVDSLAEHYADEKGISKLVLRPQYKRFGKGAPLVRNEKMVEIADSVLAIWDGKSSGTLFTVEKAKSLGKEVTVIYIENTQG